jgi:hypothetical protein
MVDIHIRDHRSQAGRRAGGIDSVARFSRYRDEVSG